MEGKKVVLGFDGSPESRDALVFARLMARAAGAEIVVVAAAEFPTLPTTALDPDPKVFGSMHRILQEANSALSGIPVETRMAASSSAARALHDVAEAEKAMLIVIGSTHRAALGRVLTGSVGERLMHGAPCALAVPPRGYAKGDHYGLGLIGVGYDDSAEAQKALVEARRLAIESDSELRLIGVAQTPNDDAEGREALRAEMQQRLDEAAHFAAIPDAEGREVKIETIVTEGRPPDVLADEGIELDVLFVGSRGYGPVMRTMAGGVSEQLIRLAPCPVVVVPRGKHRHRVLGGALDQLFETV